MAVRSFPFADQQDAPEDDYYRLHREYGVIGGLDLTFNGLTWSLAVGEMYAAGSMMIVENKAETGTSTPTTGSLPRRDMLVARRTLTKDGNISRTVPAVISGALAATPSDPNPTQNRTGVFEEPLWSWQVPSSGGSQVTNVRDLRAFRLPSGDIEVSNRYGRDLRASEGNLLFQRDRGYKVRRLSTAWTLAETFELTNSGLGFGNRLSNKFWAGIIDPSASNTGMGWSESTLGSLIRLPGEGVSMNATIHIQSQIKGEGGIRAAVNVFAPTFQTLRSPIARHSSADEDPVSYEWVYNHTGLYDADIFMEAGSYNANAKADFYFPGFLARCYPVR
jgi:hypothetical protein